MDSKNFSKNHGVYKNIKAVPGDQRNGRNFCGPNEKKQFYISQFIHFVDRSDSHNKIISKTELSETENVLRKIITSNLRLYKLVQVMVDDCVLLDNDVLELMSTVSIDKIPRCPEGSIKKISFQVDKQRRFLSLARFNKNRCLKIEKSSKLKNSMNQINTISELNALRKQTEINYFNSIASKPTNNVHLNPSVMIIAQTLLSLDKMMLQYETLFKAKLIDTDKMLSLSLLSNANNAQLRGQLFEKDKPCKTRFIVLCSFLCELGNLMSQFKERIDSHQERERIVFYLHQIKKRQDELFKEIFEKRILPSNNFDVFVNFVKDNLPHLSPEPFVDKLFDLQKSIILLNN